MGDLDHGILNIPLSKRGNIDAEIDRHKQRAAAGRTAEAKAGRLEFRASMARIKALLAALPDARILALAAPLGKRRASTARAGLASAASIAPARWLATLKREAGVEETKEGTANG